MTPRHPSDIVTDPAILLEKRKKREKATLQMAAESAMRAGMVLDSHDRIKPIFSNIQQIIISRPDVYPLSFDAFAEQAKWRGAELNEDHLADATASLEQYLRQGVAVAHVQAAMSYAARRNRRDPVLDLLQATTWDGIARIDQYAADYFGDDSPAAAEAMRIFWLQAVKRPMQPGCQADYTLLLIGGQGKSKSQWIRAVFGDQWAADLAGKIDEARSPQHLVGRWCLEIAELAAMRKADIESVKAFLTCTIDRYRPPYGRYVVSQARRCVFVGTTNDDRPLKDATGNRRFMPVVVADGIDVEAAAATRLQLFAEAVHRVKAGEKAWSENESIMAEAQEAHYDTDEWATTVAEWLKLQPPNHDFTVTEVFRDALGGQVDRLSRADQMRIGAVLRWLGCGKQRVRSSGSRAMRWVKAL